MKYVIKKFLQIISDIPGILELFKINYTILSMFHSFAQKYKNENSTGPNNNIPANKNMYLIKYLVLIYWYISTYI